MNDRSLFCISHEILFINFEEKKITSMSRLTLFGLFSVTAMLVCYAL